MARWTIDEQIMKTDEKIKELQAKKRELQARKIEFLKGREQEELRELYTALREKGIGPEQYSDVIKRLEPGN